MADFVEILSPKALEDLRTANDEVLTLISNMDKVGQSMKKVSTPSGANSAVADLTNKYKEQEKTISYLQNKLVELEQAKQRNAKSTKTETQLILDQAKSYQSLAAQKDKAIAQAVKEEQILAKANSLYNQTQQKVNQLTATYNDLAIKKELGGKLTNLEIIQLSKLTSELNVYQSALIKVDKDIQKNGRNVGNYASGWNGLGNSINQLSREMPAFANSAQTGFMALSNNLPILFDEINKVKTANKELIAQGQPIKSTFMQIAGAIFSWQTLLSVGVTVLTLYGAKIWDSISGSKERKIALEAEKKAIEDKVQAEKNQNEQIGQSIASEQNRARILFEIAKNTEVSDKKRNEALKELRDRYGKYLTDLTNQEILAGKTAEQEERLNEALIGRGYALATQNLLEKNATEQMALQVEYQKTLSSSFKDLQKLRNDDGSIKNEKEYYKILRQSGLENNKALETLNAKLKPLKAEEDALLQLFRGNAKYLEVITEKGKVEKKNAKEKELFDENSKTALENQIKDLTELQGKVDESSYTYSLLDFQIKLLTNTLKAMKGEFSDVNNEAKDLQETISLTDEQVYYEYFAWLKLRDATDEYIKTISSGAIEKALDSIGFSSAKMFLDFDEQGMSTFNKLIEGANTMKEKFAVVFQGVGDVFQDVMNMMAQASQARFDREREQLAQETEIALAFAGESDTARAEIERQAEQRRKEIARREFKAKKEQAIFNIAIDTAQAIVGIWAQVPKYDYGISAGLLSAFVGVLGLAQIAMVQSQQPPAYKMGTDNHIGGAMLVNDGAGSNYKETIQTPDGKIYQPKERNVIMNAPKGTKVFTHDQWQRNLDNILTSNSINYSQPNVVVNSGMSDEQVDRIVNTIANKQEAILSIDKNGWNTSVRNGHTQKEILNNQVTFGR
jgi:hypothetical protein